MQAYAPVIHRQKRHGQHQRDGDRDHQTWAHIHIPAVTSALVQPKCNKTHHQHNQHRFNQNADKFAHRTRDRFRLVLHLHQRHASRQRFFNARGGGLQRFAQLDDVAAFCHRHAKADDFFALVVHLHTRWVDITAGHVGNITQLELLARTTANRHRFEFGLGVKLAADTYLKYINRRLHRAGVFHRVFLAELCQDRTDVQAQLSEFFLRDFDEDFFVLHPKLFDLGYKGNAQELLAHIVSKAFHFRWRKPRCI